ncbi:NYN domain/Helix-turn-helix [Dehalogenimonas alkenigignens]|uniref:NYN domain/Helix-turn-helix n=1 Tax=Dehalogenimonas alkenigignens TaxID=1217799 RepID=A0A0W0GGW1_9CHLR|nr:helix-turn-helix domain-containing protein [Dehalogenimonas alkenigignens]KTB47802.1 NYN domain/Helix-turn-helix [Dehalogenimonas alkenigignens]
MAPLKSSLYVFNPEGILGVRNQLRLTQQQFADKLGVTKAAISRWEKGTVKPDADSLAGIYSIAVENRVQPEFFVKTQVKVEQGRSRLIVAWDFQNLAVSPQEFGKRDSFIRTYLNQRFPTITYSLFKVFASPIHATTTTEMAKLGWRLQEFDHDVDEELDSQVWSDCNQNAENTIFVLITQDGDFAELINDLRQKGVRTYLIAPECSSQGLKDAVGKKGWIVWPR